MAKHQGLGRGLDALLEESELPEQFSENGVQLKDNSPVALNLPEGISSDENGTLWVDPSLLKPNPHQPRTYFDDEKLAELTESVRQEGILSPVIIEDAQDGTFFIIAGERRTRAARAAGLEKIPVQLRKYSEQRKLEVALIENIQRTDLNPLEEAQAYYDLMELGNLTQDQVAERVGKNRSTVANCLRLLKLPEDIQKALVTDTISPGHARAILSLENDSDRRLLFARIVGQGLSVRQTENAVHEMKTGSAVSSASGSASVRKQRDPNLEALEQKLIDRLGTKVQLKGGFEKGTISINYFSSSDLDRIFSLIVPDANL
ncbi:ParB/RepB/Spo0J family partition protein [Treponema sp.]|uniref:ParB/RepB/Spo0J family partition protein n=1 Tax=Treponema sp. TaxID=166 RepID=UPI003F0F5804